MAFNAHTYWTTDYYANIVLKKLNTSGGSMWLPLPLNILPINVPDRSGHTFALQLPYIAESSLVGKIESHLFPSWTLLNKVTSRSILFYYYIEIF